MKQITKQKIRQLIIGIVSLTMCSCGIKSNDKDFIEYVDGKQRLTVNAIKRNGDKIEEPQINLVAADATPIGEEFLAKIFLSGPDFVLVDAFVDCENVDNAYVDTVTYKVSGCKQGLIVKDDTILVAFTPTSSGVKTFSEITILTRDAEKVFRTMKYSFNYKVGRK